MKAEDLELLEKRGHMPHLYLMYMAPVLLLLMTAYLNYSFAKGLSEALAGLNSMVITSSRIFGLKITCTLVLIIGTTIISKMMLNGLTLIEKVAIGAILVVSSALIGTLTYLVWTSPDIIAGKEGSEYEASILKILNTLHLVADTGCDVILGLTGLSTIDNIVKGNTLGGISLTASTRPTAGGAGSPRGGSSGASGSGSGSGSGSAGSSGGSAGSSAGGGSSSSGTGSSTGSSSSTSSGTGSSSSTTGSSGSASSGASSSTGSGTTPPPDPTTSGGGTASPPPTTP